MQSLQIGISSLENIIWILYFLINKLQFRINDFCCNIFQTAFIFVYKEYKTVVTLKIFGETKHS